MDRFTSRDEIGVVVRGDGTYSDWGSPEGFRGEAIERLAAYEDAEDEERLIVFESAEKRKHIQELVEAEKDGRLVVLPRKAGDTVWIHALVPCGACPHGADPAKICGQAGCPVHPIPVSFSVRMHDVIGKTVFLTRSEAEAALEKMKEDEENDGD